MSQILAFMIMINCNLYMYPQMHFESQCRNHANFPAFLYFLSAIQFAIKSTNTNISPITKESTYESQYQYKGRQHHSRAKILRTRIIIWRLPNWNETDQYNGKHKASVNPDPCPSISRPLLNAQYHCTHE